MLLSASAVTMFNTPAGMPARMASSAARQCGQRCEFCRLDDDGTACCQRRGHLSGDHGQREVPGRDGGAHPNGLLQHHQAAVVVELGQCFAIHALGLFGKPLHEAGAIGHFAFGLGQGLALLGGHDAAQVVLVGHQQIKPLAQDGAALFGGFAAPGWPGGVGGGDGLFCINRAQVGHVGQVGAGGGVSHGKSAAAADPLAVDQRIGFQQGGVFEQ
jgi:hypothetical protein